MSATGTEQHQQSPAVQVVLEYFAIVDGKKEGDLLALFAKDAEVFFPKYGVGRGHQAVAEIGGGLMKLLSHIEHDVQDFRILESGGTVVVEGTTHGTTADGADWRPGEGAGGRFCSVFDLRDDQIQRMSIYLDPDYGNADGARYPWAQNRQAAS